MDSPLIGYAIGILIAVWFFNNEEIQEVFCAIVLLLFIGFLIVVFVYAGILCLLVGKIISGILLITIGIVILRWLAGFWE